MGRMDEITYAIIEAQREADEMDLPADASCYVVVPDDGGNETSVFADGSYVRDWAPRST